jgi:hypothetical protein
MRKPIFGDKLTIRYNGETLQVTCNEVRETPDLGPGAANFTIISKSLFQTGGDATLLSGAAQLPLKVGRVTSITHRRIHIVSLSGSFETAAMAAAIAQ